MTWLRFDDATADHPKITGLSDLAFRWWFRGCCYSARFLLDGVLPAAFIAPVPPRVVAELRASGLWEPQPNNTITIHDYGNYQPDRASVLAKRQQVANRVKRFRNGSETQVVTRYNDDVKRVGNDAPDPDPLPLPHSVSVTHAVPARPLISGEASPKGWAKIHGNHIAQFCDWLCLPDFIASEFARKTGKGDQGPVYVTEWARDVRKIWEGQTIGADALAFWRARWADSHVIQADKPDLAAQREADRERGLAYTKERQAARDAQEGQS